MTNDDIAHRALTYLDANRACSLTLDDVARELGVSVRSLTARFRATVGCTVTSYLRLLRLAEALTAMMTTGDKRENTMTTFACTPTVGAPIFILSNPRSGSTLLRFLLDAHPSICCPGELRLGAICEFVTTAVESTLGQLSASPASTDRKVCF